MSTPISLNTALDIVRSIKNNSTISFSSREALIQYGLGRALAYSIPVPAEESDTPSAFFDTAVRENGATLSAINEFIPVMPARIITIAKAIWMSRYNVVYAPLSKAALIFTDAVVAETNESTLPSELVVALRETNAVDATNISVAQAMYGLLGVFNTVSAE